MAGPADLLSVSTTQIQNATTYILWTGLGLFFAAIIFFLFYKIIENSKYKINAFVFKKIGDQYILVIDKVREKNVNDAVMYHYKKLNNWSPRFDSKYLSICKTFSLFGLLPKTSIGLVAFLYGNKITPVKVSSNPGIIPIDYDAWNYLVQRLRINHEKYVKNQQLMRILPFITMGGVIVAFIIGSILWGQHVENVATMIIESAKDVSVQALEQAGKIQVIGK